MPARRAEQLRVAERRERLLEARGRGLTFAQIVQSPGFESYGLAAKGIDQAVAMAVQDHKRALAVRHQEVQLVADMQVTEELGRIAGLERRGHAIMAQCTEAGDRQGALRALSELRRLSERRSLILGLEAISAQVNTDTGGRESTQDDLARKRAARRAAGRPGRVAGGRR